MALSIGSRDSVSFLLTIQATGLLTVTLMGLPPTAYASPVWTLLHAGLSRRSRLPLRRRLPCGQPAPHKPRALRRIPAVVGQDRNKRLTRRIAKLSGIAAVSPADRCHALKQKKL